MSKHTQGALAQVVWVMEDDARAGKKSPTCEANARLIAAAPELLSALSTMLTEMGMDENEWNKPTYNQARAAIAKAGGTE